MSSGWRRGVVRCVKAGIGPLALFLVGAIVPLWPWWLVHGGKLMGRALGLSGSYNLGWRHRVVRWTKVGGTLLTLFVFFSVVPAWPWWPTCGGKLITGDYRDVYVDEFARFLAREDVYYWRSGDLVLVRALPWLDGNELWGQEAVILNAEKKLADALSDDQTIDGVFYPAPDEVKRLKKELEPIIGPDRRFAPDGTRLYYGSDTRVSRNCRLFRAAILEPES
jgi:hypothetical protein